jgi:hypothetical protein
MMPQETNERGLLRPPVSFTTIDRTRTAARPWWVVVLLLHAMIDNRNKWPDARAYSEFSGLLTVPRGHNCPWAQSSHRDGGTQIVARAGPDTAGFFFHSIG